MFKSNVLNQNFIQIAVGKMDYHTSKFEQIDNRFAPHSQDKVEIALDLTIKC